MARKRRKSTKGLGRRAASGRGQYCVMTRKGSGKNAKSRTICYSSEEKASQAAHKARPKGGYKAVFIYKRKRS